MQSTGASVALLQSLIFIYAIALYVVSAVAAISVLMLHVRRFDDNLAFVRHAANVSLTAGIMACVAPVLTVATLLTGGAGIAGVTFGFAVRTAFTQPDLWLVIITGALFIWTARRLGRGRVRSALVPGTVASILVAFTLVSAVLVAQPGWQLAIPAFAGLAVVMLLAALAARKNRKK